MKSLASQAHAASRSEPVRRRLPSWLTRKIWLPKLIYESLPALYSVFGLSAIAATLFLPGWSWLIPFGWLLGLMCLHGAIVVSRVRRAYRRHQNAGNNQEEQLD